MRTPLRILVAEDEMDDIVLLKRAFSKAAVPAPVYFARDGQQVVNYLSGLPPFDDPVRYPLPGLLLLDLGLPNLDGFEVLTWVRSQPDLARLLVVVFTSHQNEEDISRAYALGANSYVLKPNHPAELVAVVRRIEDYWFSINTPDPRTAAQPHLTI